MSPYSLLPTYFPTKTVHSFFTFPMLYPDRLMFLGRKKTVKVPYKYSYTRVVNPESLKCGAIHKKHFKNISASLEAIKYKTTESRNDVDLLEV